MWPVSLTEPYQKQDWLIAIPEVLLFCYDVHHFKQDLSISSYAGEVWLGCGMDAEDWFFLWDMQWLFCSAYYHSICPGPGTCKEHCYCLLSTDSMQDSRADPCSAPRTYNPKRQRWGTNTLGYSESRIHFSPNPANTNTHDFTHVSSPMNFSRTNHGHEAMPMHKCLQDGGGRVSL